MSGTAPTHPCPECGAPVVSRGPWQLFCNPACRRAHHYREGIRGRRLMAYAPVARATRNGTRGQAQEAGAHATQRMNQLLAEWREEDAKAGRMDPVQLAQLRHRTSYDW
jgi:primosomal protein N'